jgi:hypothetical protein
MESLERFHILLSFIWEHFEGVNMDRFWDKVLILG